MRSYVPPNSLDQKAVDEIHNGQDDEQLPEAAAKPFAPFIP